MTRLSECRVQRQRYEKDEIGAFDWMFSVEMHCFFHLIEFCIKEVSLHVFGVC